MTDKPLFRLLQWSYDNLVREYLPRKFGVFNGVVTREPRLLDSTDVKPEYEQPCVDAINAHLNKDDTVGIIGGGAGVTAIIAANTASRVDVYEGARERTERIREAVRLNEPDGTVTVINRVVGDAVDVWGTQANTMQVSALPDYDYLEIDAEGAELSILRNLQIRPRILVVEAHPHLDADIATVKGLLSELGYMVIEEAIEVPGESIILTGKQESSQ